MANVSETTFKDLQMDERYKRLERTLKMVLLKNAESNGITDNQNTGTWQSISSINGDNLDTSCTAMSVQSSRIGSEVVSSSSNLRNIMSRKKQFVGTRVATSSENQYPVSKDADSAMMPPPRFPCLSSKQSKRSRSENERTPLLNMSVNLDQNNQGFTISPRANCVFSISESPELAEINSDAALGEKNNYCCGNNGDEPTGDARPAKARERVFSRWRVLLNDKGQLIIKGTLECGKIARSKPVIRRLAATRVQSIFKHTYHLRGNLVDERNELPDYVSGKFFNGFPDDWENVYQVWRNFVGDGSRLSFRWPTPITDSDDDIKSEITETSYHLRFEKRNDSRSPRKRRRSSKPSSPVSSFVVDNENRLDVSQSTRSRMSTPSVGITFENSVESLENFSKSRSKSGRSKETVSVNASIGKNNKSFHDTSTMSLNVNQRVVGNSLRDIIQEDKIGMIIDNLTSKNCSMEYIRKIVEMFDCMRYVVSYQSAESNDSENITPSRNVEGSSWTPGTQGRSVEATDRANTSRCSVVKVDRFENPSMVGEEPKNSEKIPRDRRVGDVQRKLSMKDYDSTESENDYCDTRGRIPPLSTSHETIHKSRVLNKDYKLSSSAVKSRQRCDDSERSLVTSHGKFAKARVSTSKGRDSSLSEEEFPTEGKSTLKESRGGVFGSPKKRRVREKDFGGADSRDSSISITEDEECYGERSKLGNPRTRDRYDSSVSITEDERDDARIDRENFEKLKYHPESRSRPVDPDVRRTDTLQDEPRSPLVKYYPESNSRSADPDIGRGVSDQRNSRKTTTLVRPTVNQGNLELLSLSNDPTIRSQGSNGCADDLPREHQEDSTHVSSDVKRQKLSDPISTVAETESNKSYAGSRSNENDFQRVHETRALTPAKIQQVKKMPVVVSSEIVSFDIQGYERPSPRNTNENDTNANKPTWIRADLSGASESSNETKNNLNGQKNSENSLPERAKIAETAKAKSTSREAIVNVKEQNGKTTKTRETSSGNFKPTDLGDKSSVEEFGSEKNPKQLTGWVPAVICDDEDNRAKCRLIFEGKLLNEAGHVVNRKFATDFVARRLSPKLIETIGHVFYRLVGDLNDTKHVVPKDLVKQCRIGCPSKINNFCEKWKLLSSERARLENNEIPTKQRSHNTSVDCLSVRTSSRGRRILPPLNYWTGERITTKDNKAIYSPGNCDESSIPSSLEKTNEEITDKRNSPRAQRSRGGNNETREKQTGESGSNGAKKKEMHKISPPTGSSKSTAKKVLHSHESQRTRNGKRRLMRKTQESSSESDEEEKTKPVLRKRKTKTNDPLPSTDTTSTRKLRNSSRNTTSSQSLEQSTGSRPASFEKPAETEFKSKLRKRQKIDQDEAQTVVAGNSKQLTTRGSSEITCTFYKNVPLHDDDLSEDQLSIM